MEYDGDSYEVKTQVTKELECLEFILLITLLFCGNVSIMKNIGSVEAW